MSLGTEWLVDATGCDAAALRSVEALDRLFARVIAEVQLKPLHAPAFHVFPGEGGITACNPSNNVRRPCLASIASTVSKPSTAGASIRSRRVRPSLCIARK